MMTVVLMQRIKLKGCVDLEQEALRGLVALLLLSNVRFGKCKDTVE